MAAPSAPIMGFQGKAYYNSGTYGSPTWVLVSNMADVKVTDEMNESTLALRSQGGMEVIVAGLRKVAFEWDAIWDPADTALLAIQTRYLARTKTDLLFLDQAQATAGSYGARVQALFNKFARQENINDAMMVNISAKPTYDNTNTPVSAYTAS